jgi:ribonucleoside-diphosphate reductase alpha chain
VESFIDIRRPTGGDENRRCLNLHHGLNITDEFMSKVTSKGMFDLICPHTGNVVKQVDARALWKNILKNRVESGEPYLTYIDSVHKQALPSHTEKGLKIRAGNLCQEIILPTNKDRTAICVLASINIEQCPLDQLEYVSAIATEALDNVLTLFLKTANPRDYKRAIYSASKERSIGLGLMGWHGYLMREKIPFEGVQSVALAKIISEKIQNAARAKSIELAKTKGECEDNPGNRNSYLTAIAPTANISIIAGNCTPCIEPIAGNAYLQKTLSGSFLVKNVYLENLLKEKGQNTAKVWKSIIKNAGSVQQLDFLSEEEKKLFKTAYELDQRFIVKQAAARQKHICQAQSLNLFFGRTENGEIDGMYLHQVHYEAWESGVKTLYYLRSDSVLSAKINTEECVACQ